MDNGRGVGQLRARLVMVGDNQIDAQLPGKRRLFHAADAAIDRDDQIDFFRRFRADRLGAQPVTFVEPVGDIIAHVGPQQFQAHIEQGRAGHAVDVVIAVDANPLSGAHGLMNAARRLLRSRAEVADPEDRTAWDREIPWPPRDRSRRG